MSKLSFLNPVAIKSFFIRFVKNLSWMFLAALLLLIFFEVLELKRSVTMILDSQKDPVDLKTEKGVRIQFVEYDKVVNRIKAASTFRPTITSVKDPFGSK